MGTYNSMGRSKKYLALVTSLCYSQAAKKLSLFMCFRRQNAGFGGARAGFLHTPIINLRTEIKDPRAKERIDCGRKGFSGAAHGQPPPTAGKAAARNYF